MHETNIKSTLDIMCDALINQSCLFLILALTPSIKIIYIVRVCQHVAEQRLTMMTSE